MTQSAPRRRIMGEKRLKIHFDFDTVGEKNIRDIAVDKVVDFRLLREVRKESTGK